MPAHALDLMARAPGYGVSTPVSLASFDRASRSSKTSPACSQEEPPKNSPTIDAYAAGLIDGEGCISIAHADDRVFYPRLDIGMSAKGLPVLQRMLEIYGGSIQRTRAKSARWEEAQAWRLFGKPLKAMLRRVEPYLVLKREQARIALRLIEMTERLPRTPNGRGGIWSEEASEQGRMARAAVMDLNRKGPAHDQEAGWFAKLVAGTWTTPQRDMLNPHGSAAFSATWPRSGSMRSGIAYRLPPLAPLTFGTASGLLPTVTATTYGSTNNGTRGDGTTFNTAGTPSLDTMSRRGLLPTPQAMDYDKPRRGPGSIARGGGMKLLDALEKWGMVPSPGANDHRSGKGFDPSGRGHSPQLRHLTGGLLNPAWVLWLMGFPAEHLRSGLSEMQSSRRSPKRSDGRS